MIKVHYMHVQKCHDDPIKMYNSYKSMGGINEFHNYVRGLTIHSPVTIGSSGSGLSHGSSEGHSRHPKPSNPSMEKWCYSACLPSVLFMGAIFAFQISMHCLGTNSKET
jgi:hypothetical protein